MEALEKEEEGTKAWVVEGEGTLVETRAGLPNPGLGSREGVEGLAKAWEGDWMELVEAGMAQGVWEPGEVRDKEGALELSAPGES